MFLSPLISISLLHTHTQVRQECGGDEAVEAAVLRAKQQWEGEKEAAVTQAVR